MQLNLSLTIGLLAGCVAAISSCGTSGPSEALRSVASQLQKRDGTFGSKSHLCVDTYVHVIAASQKVEEGYISDKIVRGQINLLNQRFAPHDISFNLIKTDRTINESWAYPDGSPVRPSTEPVLKEALRKGDYTALNLYFVASIIPGGKCELPIPNPSRAQIIDDGCLLRPVEPGTKNPDYGLVTVHEVGHWLGLLHTFEAPEDMEDGTGCDGPGDYVDDTPAEAYPVAGEECAEPGRDTCPDLPGLDPVDNHMTYISDKCGPKRFTPGQARRMHDLWKEIRLPLKGK